MGECFGAVNGIDNPSATAAAGHVVMFFAEDCIVRESLVNQIPQEPFGFSVRGRHRSAVTFALNFEFWGPEPTQREFAGFAQHGNGNIEECRIRFGRGHHRIMARESER